MNQPAEIWRRMAEMHRSFVDAIATLQQSHSSEMEQLLHKTLEVSGSADFGIEILRHLNPVTVLHFVDDLLGLASYSNRATRSARNQLLSMDSSWLRENLVEKMKPLLADEESFNALFQLAIKVHPSCGRAVLELADQSQDPEVRLLVPYMEKELGGAT